MQYTLGNAGCGRVDRGWTDEREDNESEETEKEVNKNMGIRKKFYGKMWTKASTGFKKESDAEAEAKRRDKVSIKSAQKYGTRRQKHIVKKMGSPIARESAPFVIFSRKIAKRT